MDGRECKPALEMREFRFNSPLQLDLAERRKGQEFIDLNSMAQK